MGLSEEEQTRAMLDATVGESMQDLPEIEPAAGESESPAAPEDQHADSEAEIAAATPPELLSEPKLSQTSRSETAYSGLAASRDLSVQTLVHLLGLPTATQFQVLETKLEVLTQKLQTIQLKIERVQSHLDSADTAATVDRIDYQISDIRTILKKLFPSLGVGFEGDGSGAQKKPARAPQVLTSGGKTTGTAEQQESSARSEFNDQEFQQQEARRLRQDSTRTK